MPTTAEIRQALTDITVEVTGCAPEAVVPQARLKDIGVDSLAVVEIAEGLGRRFDLYLDDDAVDALVTVQDAIDAVERGGQGKRPKPGAVVPPPVKAAERPPRDESPATDPEDSPATSVLAAVAAPELAKDPDHLKRKAWGLAGTMAVLGAVIGVAAGVAVAAGVKVSGMTSPDIPPVAVATTSKPTPTATPTTTTPTTTSPTATPEPTLTTDKTTIAPGERLTLSGRFPELGSGATLQVQIKDTGQDWDDFPVTTKTKDDGVYSTIIYTTRTGERKVRLVAKDTDAKTPAVTITIG